MTEYVVSTFVWGIVPNFLINQFADMAEIKKPSEMPASSDYFNVCVKIRLHNRVCVNQLDILLSLLNFFNENRCKFKNLYNKKIKLYIDGYSSYMGMSQNDEKAIKLEIEWFARFARDVFFDYGGLIELESTIGLSVSQKASIACNLDLYLSPVGSGGELYTWVYKVPSIFYGTTKMVDLAKKHTGGGVVESLPWIALLETKACETGKGALDDYFLEPTVLQRAICDYFNAFIHN